MKNIKYKPWTHYEAEYMWTQLMYFVCWYIFLPFVITYILNIIGFNSTSEFMDFMVLFSFVLLGCVGVFFIKRNLEKLKNVKK